MHLHDVLESVSVSPLPSFNKNFCLTIDQQFLHNSYTAHLALHTTLQAKSVSSLYELTAYDHRKWIRSDQGNRWQWQSEPFIHTYSIQREHWTNSNRENECSLVKYTFQMQARLQVRTNIHYNTHYTTLTS